MRAVPRVVAAAAAVCALGGAAQAFDCGKAETAVEVAICASPALVAMDDAMAVAYGEIKSLSSAAEKKMLARAQKRWIAERESACGTLPEPAIAACAGDEIAKRIALFAGKPESGPGTGSRLMPVFVIQDGAPGSYDIAYNLLRFAEPRSAGERLFNAAIAKIVTEAPLGMKVEEVDRELATQADVEISYASPALLSARDSFWSDDGGAHGNGGIDNINIDLAAARELEVSDVFSQEAAAQLVKRCRQQIVADKTQRLADEAYDPGRDDFLKDEVIAEHIATMSRWTLSASEAIVTFDAYAIGPYSDGSYECRFPMAEVKALAVPGAPLP